MQCLYYIYMGQNFDYKICRLASPEKQHERILVSGILQNDESHNTERVVLTYLIEINKPWFSANRLLDVLKESLENGFPALEANSNLDDQFEQLLKKVNRNLNDLSETGETDWIGNLNALIMAIGENEIHFSMTGYCPSYILQNNRIRQITDNSDINSEPHPLKTFSNLASGTIQENDTILIANSELYREISLDSLRRLINSGTPAQSILSIAKEAKKEKNLGLSAIICQICVSGSSSSPEAEEIFMEDIMQSPLAKLKKKALPVWGGIKHVSTQAGIKTIAAAKAGHQVLGEKIIPKADEIVSNISQNLSKNKATQEPKEEDKIEDKVDDKKEVATDEDKTTSETDENMAKDTKEIETIGQIEITEPEKPETPSLIPSSEFALDSAEANPTNTKYDNQSFSVFVKNIFSSISKGIVKFNSLFPLIYRYCHKGYLGIKIWLKLRRNQKITALIGAVILVLITVLGICNSLKPKQKVDSAQNNNKEIITQIQNLEAKINSAVALNQQIEASRDIAEINRLFIQVQNPNDSERSIISTAKDNIASKEDSLSGIIRLDSPSTFAPFSQSSNGLIVNMPYIYGFNSTSNNLLRSGKGEATLVQGLTALPSSNDSIVAMAHSAEDDIPAYVITKQANVLKVKQGEGNTTLEVIAPADGEFFSGDAISVYNQNIYILDGKNGLLWKYAWNGQGYNKGINIIDVNQYDIRKSVSLAIDGSIYVLKQDGTLHKFISGKQDEAFSLRGQPEISKQLIRPSRIITNEDMSKLYLVDLGNNSGERSSAKIQVFDKSGQYTQQFGFPKEFTDIKAIDINESEKKIWVLNKDQISEFNMP